LLLGEPRTSQALPGDLTWRRCPGGLDRHETDGT
jgi:hypothetical protein